MSDFNEKALFGSKHFSNKKPKQKNPHSKTSKKQPQPVHPTPIQLASNQHFYDDPSSDEDTSDHSCAPDFNQLINSSVSNVGGHFYFADEKKALANKEESLKSSLFYIDGKVLQRALATIPLYERFDYNVDNFTAEEIEAQEQKAAKNEEAYRKLLETRGTDMIINRIRGKSAGKKLPEIRKNEEVLTSDSHFDELDDLLERKSFSILENPIAGPIHHSCEAESEDNMQRWLDNLLN